MVHRRATLLVALVGADGGTIGLLRPRLGPLAGHLRHPHRWVAAVGPDRALAALSAAALWLAAVWLAVGLLAGLAAWLPGSAGRWAERAGRVLLPRAVRGLVAGSAGLGVLLAPAAAGAATPTTPTSPPGPGTTSSQSASIPAPEWPQSPTGSPSSDPPAAIPSVPAPTWPAPPPERPATPAEHGVQVRAGDCLWLIASRRLGPEASAADVAAEWPRWYAANKTLIGADPAVIHPGEVLQPPPART